MEKGFCNQTDINKFGNNMARTSFLTLLSYKIMHARVRLSVFRFKTGQSLQSNAKR